MRPVISSPTPRVPYRAAGTGTPPISPIRLSSPSPLRYHTSYGGDNDYPESPTRKTRRLPSISIERPPHLALNGSSSSSKSSWRIPRGFKATKKCLTFMTLFGVVVFLFQWSARDGEIISISGGLNAARLRFAWSRLAEEQCQFVSPVEAYQRDLARLRSLHSGTDYLANLTDSIPQNHSLPHHHHQYSNTGHLLISDSPGAPHPIPLLLALGEKRWEEALSRQSRTLSDAVSEYIRRYGRRPPKGFDLWWDFATAHDLVLPDEYDRINLDLAPFFALPKAEMKRRMELVEGMGETFTLIIEDGQVRIQLLDKSGLGWDGTKPRAKQMAQLLRGFARFLPNMRATFSIFDQPQIYLSWARRGSLVELGLRGEHTTHLHETDDAHVRLSRSCPPESNLRINSSLNEGKSFVYDSLEAGDFCQNPYIVPLHGLTIETHDETSHPRPHTQLLPLFSLAKTAINSDILITPLEQFYDRTGSDPDREDKRSSKLAWRGHSTGMSMMSKNVDWRNAHRIRLHHFANNRSMALTSFIVPDLGQFEEDDPEGEDERQNTQRYDQSAQQLGYTTEDATVGYERAFYFDMKLSGPPLQCDEEDGTCQDMAREIDSVGYQSSSALNKHKFLLDIDGNGWSARFRRLMSTNSLVIKTGIFTEWFQPHLIPWFMYVPAKLDFSDLTDILAFFRGTPKHPNLGFDETAKALARNGQCFVQRMFRMVDLEAYMMRLFLEYARLAADEGVDMDFYLEETEEDSGEDVEEDPLPADDVNEVYDNYDHYEGGDEQAWLGLNDTLAADMDDMRENDNHLAEDEERLSLESDWSDSGADI